MIMNNEGRVPTTDEMDETTPEERHKLSGMCGSCFEWTHFDDEKDERVCKCGGKLVQSTIRSQRTYNEEWAKKESAKAKRKIKK